MTIWKTICREKQRNVNVFDLTAVGIGSSLAVGAFVVFGDLIKNVTGPAVLLSVTLAGVTALLGGICFTELGVQFLKADSSYIFSYSFSQKQVAFVFGWALILQYVAGAASVGKGIIMFIDALTENKISNFLRDVAATNFENVFLYFDFLSFSIIIIVIILLAVGIKDSTAVKNIFTLCNIVLVVSVLVAGSLKADVENWRTIGSEDEKVALGFMPFGILGVTKGAAIVFYGFVGFDNIGVSGSEVKSRKKNLPIAVLTTIIAVFLAYLGIGAILTLMLPYYKLNENASLPFAFEHLGSTAAKWIIIVASFFGFLTSLFGASFPLPRIIQTMASDGLLFSFLDNNPPKKDVSKTAIIFGGLLTAAATGIFNFHLLVSLTVLGALCVYTIIAINVILTRYSRRRENLLEPWTAFINEDTEISVKMAMKNYFSFKETTITKFTEKIVIGNVLLYCLSSIGLSVMYSVFSDSLFRGSVEAVVPSCMFLCIILLSLFSLIRQPKLQLALPFEVPFVPLLPCLSIFLNIFLTTTFDSITWIFFSCWMALGILFHLVWRCLDSCNKLSKDSLYEINKCNALKLNEAIWKINSEKKSFYEGAVNPVFTDESENMPEKVTTPPENEIKLRNEETVLQLQQAEIIQTAEMILEEKTEPLENEHGSQFPGFDGNPPDESNSVHWECVAEIHTEEEFPQESVAEIHTEEFPQESVVLEIVDNTYNFLSEESEESPKDNVSEKSAYKPKGLVGSVKESKMDESKCSDISDEVTQVPPTALKNDIKKFNEVNPYRKLEFHEELFNKIKSRRKISKENLEEKISEQQNSEECQNEDEFVNFVIETFYEAPKGEMISRKHKKIICDNDDQKETEIPEEHNRIKEFKEKLNQLLKNQINYGGSPEKSFTVFKNDADDEEMKEKKSETAFFDSIRTLNKSQIRGKLEVLLAKGPPKRPSFKSRFREVVQNEKEEIEHVTNVSEESATPGNNDITADFVEVETLPNNTRKKSLNYSGTELPNGTCC